MFAVDEDGPGFDFDGVFAKCGTAIVTRHLFQLDIPGQFDFLFDGDFSFDDLGLCPGKEDHDPSGNEEDDSDNPATNQPLISNDEDEPEKAEGSGDEIGDCFHGRFLLILISTLDNGIGGFPDILQ